MDCCHSVWLCVSKQSGEFRATMQCNKRFDPEFVDLNFKQLSYTWRNFCCLCETENSRLLWKFSLVRKLCMEIRSSFATMEKFPPQNIQTFQDKAEREELHAWLTEMNGEWSFFRSTCRKHFPSQIPLSSMNMELMTLFAFDTEIHDPFVVIPPSVATFLLNQTKLFLVVLRKSSADDGKSLKRHFRCRCDWI